MRIVHHRPRSDTLLEDYPPNMIDVFTLLKWLAQCTELQIAGYVTPR